jgi:hypothetical protein
MPLVIRIFILQKSLILNLVDGVGRQHHGVTGPKTVWGETSGFR